MEPGARNRETIRDSLEGLLSFDLAGLRVPPSLVAQQMAAHLGERVPSLRDPVFQRLLAQAVGLLARCGRASGLRYTMREAALLLADGTLQRELGCQLEEANLEPDGSPQADAWPSTLPLPGMEDLLGEAGPGRG